MNSDDKNIVEYVGRRRIERDRDDRDDFIEKLKDQFSDYRSQLWDALGQPRNVEYIQAVKELVAECKQLRLTRIKDGLTIARLSAPVSDAEILEHMIYGEDGCDVAALIARAEGIKTWLAEFAPECFDEQLHLDEGSQERVYWHYGYYAALSDAICFLTGHFPAIQDHDIPPQDTGS